MIPDPENHTFFDEQDDEYSDGSEDDWFFIFCSVLFIIWTVLIIALFLL